MPSEIRNTTYPKTAVDLLLPQPGAGSRGDSKDGFDSLLRALAPAERKDADPPGSTGLSPSQASDRPTNSHDSANSTYTQRASDAPASRDDRPERSDRPQATSDEPAPVDDEPVTESQNSQPPAEAANATDKETGSKEPVDGTNGEVTDETTEESEETISTTVVDATAQQLAAAAAQTPVAKTDAQPTVAEHAKGDVVAELEPAAEAPATDAKANTDVTLPEAVLPTATTVEKPTVEGVATEVGAGTEQVQLAENETATPALESPDLIAVEPSVENVELAEEEQPVISDLRSTHTQSGGSIRHDTPPKQPGDTVEVPAEGAEAKLQTEAVDAVAEPETEVQVEHAEPTSNSDSTRDDDRNSEPIAAEKADRVTETSFEAATPEAIAAELPPADNAPAAAGAEPTRTESTSQPQHHQHASQHLVDGQVRAGGAPRLAAEVLAGNPRETSQSRPVEIDSARFLTRVARAFTAAQQRGGEVQMRLSPPELGSLRVEIKVVEGVMTARVETENASAQSAVLEHLPQLRERLAEQGVRIERFDVDLMQNGSSNTPDRPADRQGDEGFSRRGNQAANRPNSSAGAEPRPAAATLSASGGLNVIV